MRWRRKFLPPRARLPLKALYHHAAGKGREKGKGLPAAEISEEESKFASVLSFWSCILPLNQPRVDFLPLKRTPAWPTPPKPST